MPEGFLAAQDAYLQEKLKQKNLTRLEDLTAVEDQLYLWQGDITTLEVDAIVNAANHQLLGCFIPHHACIDNAIHWQAGLQLRLACADIMKAQGHPEAAGQAKLTSAFNLPSRYVLHTVGPIISGEVSQKDREDLVSCYNFCLELAWEKGIRSLAFCSISTGEFRFPKRLASQLAIQTVRVFCKTHPQMQVIFNVFQAENLAIYQKELGLVAHPAS